MIDRRALVSRHDVRVTAFSPTGGLSLGNGSFGITVDMTGLQTFPDACQAGLPLGMQSDWGWHSAPNPNGYTLADTFNWYESGDRVSPYPEVTPSADARDPERFKAAAAWLRENPHRLQLGFLGLCGLDADGALADLQVSDITNVAQRLDLWRGRVESRFTLGGQTHQVITAVHPDVDALAAIIRAPGGQPAPIRLRFPAPSSHWRDAWRWDDAAHITEVDVADGTAQFLRRLPGETHRAALRFDGGELRSSGPHDFLLVPTGDTLAVTLSFAASDQPVLPSARACLDAAERWWADFWTSGMAVDLSGSSDPRAAELERRIVLSQFLTAAQGAGRTPPQETGFVTNSWHGKFHLEMHPWHSAHFALWGRAHLLERSIPWYVGALDAARDTARRQGFAGARWPKMVGPDAREAPSDIGAFLIWQQPHPILLATLLLRAGASKATLALCDALVKETAAFMLDWLRHADGTFGFRTPMIPAQEAYRDQRLQPYTPTFECAYWAWALVAARDWQAARGGNLQAEIDRCLAGLPPLPVREGRYAAISVPPYTVAEDHPTMLGALGLLPGGPDVDPAVMGATLDWVVAHWDWFNTWGWDFPMAAMTAARLGRPEQAIDLLLADQPKNRYLPNGHNHLGPPLPAYLPGNGALLYAIAMMARGWDGDDGRHAPGFPESWNVRVEGGRKAI